jgi:hypothetical protein
VKEHPILFTGPNVLSILAGRKTQTRRIMRPQPVTATGYPLAVPGDWAWPTEKQSCAIFHYPYPEPPQTVLRLCPFGRVGDRLWVRETWAGGLGNSPDAVDYRADGHSYGCDEDGKPLIRWRPSIYMPRWACRLLLDVDSIRVERLQDISEEDAIAEGVTKGEQWFDGAPHKVKGTPKAYPTAREAFASRWDHINAKRGAWTSNPWVWVLSFRRASCV